MKLVIVKYNAGNTQSVAFALDRLQVAYTISNDHEEIGKADKVIFPGVGEASSAMRFLKEKQLDGLIKGLQQPVLGICLGMQLLCAHSEENDTPCLGIFDLGVKRFEPTDTAKVPHTGWNNLIQPKGWIGNTFERTFVYFAHSYYVPVNKYTVAEANYIVPFSAAMQTKNFYGVQFHPEKSGEGGAKILKQFLNIR